MNSLIGWKGYALAVGVGALLLSCFLVERHFYGAGQFRAGGQAKQDEIEKRQVAIERGIQAEKDREDAKYRGAVLAREAADRVVADQRRHIDGLLYQLRNRPKIAGASSRPYDPGEDWIGIFGQCVAEYEGMGSDAGRLADKVNGLQGYVRAILSGPYTAP